MSTRGGSAKRLGLAIAAAAACLWLALNPVTLALLSDSDALASNNFTAGTWHYFLHNNPTPPTGNTTSQVNLSATSTAPSAAGPWQFSTDIGATNWRFLLRQGNAACANTGVAENVAKCYVNWRTPAINRTLNGLLTLKIYCDKTTNGGNATLTTYFRKYNTTSTAYTELGSGTATAATGGPALLTPSLTITNISFSNVELVEVKITSTGNRDIECAYDSTSFPSELVLLQNPA